MDLSGTSAAPLKVLIADDHPLILTAVRRALEQADGIEVAGEARAARDLIGLVERRRPDVVLMDLRMPGVQDTEHIEEVRSRFPDVKIVVLSGSDDGASVESAMTAGADAFLVKSVSPADIAAMLRQVAAGFVFQPPGRRGHDSAADSEEQAGLTERERVILAAAARGMTTAEISGELYITENTVKYHLTNVYRKLGVKNRAAAVRYALEKGIA